MQPWWFALLSGFFMFPAGVLEQNVHRANRASLRRRWCGRPRTLCTTFIASLASCAAGNSPRGTSFTWWRTVGWCARWITKPQNKTVSVCGKCFKNEPEMHHMEMKQDRVTYLVTLIVTTTNFYLCDSVLRGWDFTLLHQNCKRAP